jgi:hypothetical protein
LIERANLAVLDTLTRTIRLCLGQLAHGAQAEEAKAKYGRKIPHRGAFYRAMPELGMNTAASPGSGMLEHHTEDAEARQTGKPKQIGT